MKITTKDLFILKKAIIHTNVIFFITFFTKNGRYSDINLYGHIYEIGEK
jgi:hypothetical protein